METASEIPEKVKGVFAFGSSEIAVALHFVEKFSEDHKQKDRTQVLDGPTVFTSMELDLFAYQFQRGCPPIKSGLPRKDPDPAASLSRLLFIRIPETIDYYSEGRKESISISPNLIEAQVKLSWSDFTASKLRVWHCVISPAEGKHFDEYAILALIHLYDGRAESTKLNRQIDFYLDRSDAIKISGADNLLEQLKRRYLVPIPGEVQLPKEQDFIAGTIQYAPLASGAAGQQEAALSNSDLLGNIQKVWQARRDKDKDANPALDALKKLYHDFENGTNKRPWEELRAFAGIVVGILDFRAVDFEEMLDTLVPTFTDGHIFLQINRCSMMAFTPGDRVIQDPNIQEQIGISPYLLLPHAAIIHNETLVSSAELTLDVIHRQIQSGRRARSSSLQELEREFEKATRNLGELQLPNVFNYLTERTLFDKGMETRGSLDKREAVEAKRLDTKEQIELLWKLRAERGQIWLAAILAAFTGLSFVMSNREWLDSKLVCLFGNVDVAPLIALILGLILSLAVIYFRSKGLKNQSRSN